jgi:hypothetical protein
MLMQFGEVKLHPKGAFHVGERGIGYEGATEFVPADTLFAALCAGWVLLYGEDALVSDLLPNDKPDWTPPFLISSASHQPSLSSHQFAFIPNPCCHRRKTEFAGRRSNGFRKVF